MTRTDLTRMAGEPLVNFAIDAVLAQVDLEFVRSAVREKLAGVNDRIEAMAIEGYVRLIDGSYEIAWEKATKPHRRLLTKEVEEACDRARDKCSEAWMALFCREKLTALLDAIG